MEVSKASTVHSKPSKSYMKILAIFTGVLSMKTYSMRGRAKIESIESKLIKALRDALFPSLDSLSFIISLITSIKEAPTKFDINLLSNLLCDKFTFFNQMKTKNQNDMLASLVSVLSLEYFKPEDKIIVFDDIGEKFYILLEGKVGIYRPKFFKRELSLESFCKYLFDLKNTSKDLMSLERIEHKNETYNELVYDIDTIKTVNYHSEFLPENKIIKKEYYIEENFLLAYGESGFQFGDMAFLANSKRNATIVSLTDSTVVSISKENYIKIMKELEYKELIVKTENMQRNYFMFKSWSRQNLIKILNFFSTISLVKGELLYSQDDPSDYVYFSKSGLFECYTNVSLSKHKRMANYINDSKGSLLKWIKTNYFNNINHQTISQLIKQKRAILNKIHSHNANDRRKSIKNEKRSDSTKANSGVSLKADREAKKGSVLLGDKTFKVKIRKMNEKECFGIEEVFDCKNRFSTIECISSTAEVFRINVIDLIQYICEKGIDLKEISMLIEERKQTLLFQLTNFIRFETQQSRNDPKTISNNHLSAFGFDNDKEFNSKKSPVRITNTKLSKNFSGMIVRPKTMNRNAANYFSSFVNYSQNAQEKGKTKEEVKLSMSTSQKTLKKDIKLFAESQARKKNIEEMIRQEKEREESRMMKYMASLQQKNFDSLQKEIFYMAGFHKINRKRLHMSTEDYENNQKLSPQEKVMTILNSFSLPMKSRNEQHKEAKSKKKTSYCSISNLHKNKSLVNIVLRGNEKPFIDHIKNERPSTHLEKFTQCE